MLLLVLLCMPPHVQVQNIQNKAMVTSIKVKHENDKAEKKVMGKKRLVFITNKFIDKSSN